MLSIPIILRNIYFLTHFLIFYEGVHQYFLGFRVWSKILILWRFFSRSSAKSRGTTKRPTVLSSLLQMLSIRVTLRNIYFLTHFRIFFHHDFLRKMAKIKNFLDWTVMDCKLNFELNKVWHSTFWALFALWQQKYWFLGQKMGFRLLCIFSINFRIFWRGYICFFFYCILNVFLMVF